MGGSVAVLSLLLFSSNVLLTKAASKRLDVQVGYFVSICVNVFVALILVAFEHVVLHSPFTLQWGAVLDFIIAGCLTTFIGRLTYFHAIVRLGPAKASTIQIASPVVTVVLAWIFLREVLNGLEVLGCICTLLGLLVITYVPGMFRRSEVAASVEARSQEDMRAQGVARDTNGIAHDGGGSTRRGLTRRMAPLLRSGTLIALVSLVAYGAGNLFRGDGVRAWNDPIVGGLIGALVGLVAFVSTNPQQLKTAVEWRRMDQKAIAMYCLSGVLTILAQICVLFAMQSMPIGIVTVISMSQPLLIIPLSYVLFKGAEKITGRTIVGSLLTLIGLILAVAM